TPPELPAVVPDLPMHHRHPDRVLQALQPAHDQGAVRPGAGERDVEVIATGLRLEAAFADRSGTAVRRDPVAKLGLDAHEAAVPARRLVAAAPDAFDQLAHDGSSRLPCRRAQHRRDASPRRRHASAQIVGAGAPASRRQERNPPVRRLARADAWPGIRGLRSSRADGVYGRRERSVTGCGWLRPRGCTAPPAPPYSEGSATDGTSWTRLRPSPRNSA